MATTTPKIYLFNNWHNGDILTNRCLLKALLNYDLDIAVGSYADRHYLVADLPYHHIVAEWKENAPNSPCLSTLCPKDHLPVNSWCGTFKDIDKDHAHNWAGIVRTWNRQMEIYGLDTILPLKEVPMIDFEYDYRIRTRGRGIYVETSGTRSGHCNYQFDVRYLATKFPDFNFYCTGNPSCDMPNVIDCSDKNLVELSYISNGCEAIIGKGSGPFICTLTTINRKKPKAVVAFNAPKFWIYRDNPIQYLEGDEDLLKFLQEVYDDPWQVV